MSPHEAAVVFAEVEGKLQLDNRKYSQMVTYKIHWLVHTHCGH